MKILYVITSTDLGGAEKSLAKLVNVTARENTVRVISLKPLGSVAQEIKQAGVEVMSMDMCWYNQTRIIQRLSKAIEVFQPDLVHAMLYRAIEYTRLACAGKNIKLITTPHFDLSKKSFPLHWMDVMLKDIDTLTVAESFSTARYLVEKQKYRKNKVYLLPNGVDKSVFYKDKKIRNMMRFPQGYTPENIVFVSVARLSAVKNPILLLQAFRNLLRTYPQARLVFVGEGKERKKLENFISENNMQKTVLLAGKRNNINDWLNMADVFVLGSVEESLPLSLLEALSVGLPCIVSKVGDMELWVEHGKNGFVFKPGDITLLSCFLTEVASSAENRRKMGAYSLSLAQRITDTSQQYQQIYQQVLNNSFHVKTTK